MELNQIAAALRQCGRAKALNSGKALHSHLTKLGFSRDLFVSNNLMSMYLGSSSLEDAGKVFDEMPAKNIVTWTTMVSAFTGGGRPDEALRLYGRMIALKSETPNGFLYSAVLKACAATGNLNLGRTIHEGVMSAELESDTVLMNALLDMYVKCGSLSDAVEVFDRVLFANSSTWNTIVSGFAKAGLMKEAVGFFYRMPDANAISWNTVIAGFADKGSVRATEFACDMHRKGVKLDWFTFPCFLKACGHHGMLALGKQVHCYVTKSGFESACYTVSALVDMYSDCRELITASKLFWQYSTSHNLVLWNSMLSGYVMNDHNRAALDLVSLIYNSSAFLMDSYTFSAALKACISMSSLGLGCQVHGLIITSGHGLDYIVGSILVNLYARLGKIDDALGLFHRLPQKDTVAWSGLITGCSKRGFGWHAFTLFRGMVKLNIEVDQFVISSVVKACSSLTSLRSGKQIHALCRKNGYENEGVIMTSLIDMYAKCGDIDAGLSLFKCTSERERDTVCWTGIIVGCGQNGRAKEAIGYLREMRESGFKPNEITYLGVLCACRYGGLVDEAREIFSLMKLKDGVEPCVEHYNCMVDILSQRGCFEEAKKLISEMPFEPNDMIWRSLLGACATHGNTELLNSIDRDLLRNLPEDHSTYVTLSNVYAELGLWDRLSEVRKASKDVGSKEAGKSWIEI